MAVKRTLFDVMNDLFLKRSVKYDKKIANSFILSLFLSHDKNLLKLVNEANPYINILPDELIYKYFYDKIPKGKRYIKWISKDKEDKRKKIIKELAIKNNCSIREMEISLI
jgi:hypothetical protein